MKTYICCCFNTKPSLASLPRINTFAEFEILALNPDYKCIYVSYLSKYSNRDDILNAALEILGMDAKEKGINISDCRISVFSSE